MRVIGRHQRIRIRVCMNEETAATDLLVEGVIDAKRRARHDILVVDIGRDADDAPGRGADIDELHHRIGPHHMVVDRILIREHPLRQALAHDDDRLAGSAIRIVEIASGDDRDAERREKSGRDGAEPRARIFFARGADVAVGRELEAGTELRRRRATGPGCRRPRDPRPAAR